MLRKLWNYLFPPKNGGCSCSCCDCEMEAYWNELQEYTATQHGDDEYDFVIDDLNYTASKESR